MKKLANYFMAFSLVGVLLVSSGCFGEFALTRKIYQWNQSIGNDDLDGKFVKTLVMYGLMIVPVYEVVSAVDLVVLNLVEFWTGSNPITMSEEQKEIKIIEHKGEMYQITATKNNFEIKQLGSETEEIIHSFTFNPDELSWVNTRNGVSTNLIQYSVENGEIVSATYFGANGTSFAANKVQLENAFVNFAMK